MNRADRWLGNVTPNPQSGNIEVRAMDTARLIDARPFMIVISRRDPETGETIQLAPQKVRLELLKTFGSKDVVTDKMLNELSVQRVIIIGYVDHPTIPNTDILRADRFFYDGFIWEIEDLNTTIPGRLLASGNVKP